MIKLPLLPFFTVSVNVKSALIGLYSRHPPFETPPPEINSTLLFPLIIFPLLVYVPASISNAFVIDKYTSDSRSFNVFVPCTVYPIPSFAISTVIPFSVYGRLTFSPVDILIGANANN